ncbi:MAG: branched-chain amino acid ABC transporter permease [Acidimicrobiaceae bacterium]|nr:branched-chain amino acid ABC transporter permease [Acidimicrobiaceae bacterium]
MSLFFLTLGFGLVTASVLSLLSVGLSLQFGVTNFVNFAYGSYLSAGMLFTWTFATKLHFPFVIAALAGVIFTSLLAVIVNEIVFEPFSKRRKSIFYMLIVTFGLSLVLDSVLQIFYGVGFEKFPITQSEALHIGPFDFTVVQLWIIAVAILSMIVIHLLLTRTSLGKQMRAMSDNPELAKISGVDTRTVTRSTWALSGALAGLGGVVLALNTVVFQTTTGDDLLFVIFAAVILGGIGQTYGAMLGALVIGIVTEVSAVWVSSAYKQDVAFLILVVMLLVRPQGIIPAQGKA